MRAETILDNVRQHTDKVILFSSVSGKDSILLTKLCCERFKEVVAVYMYIIKDMEFIAKYESFFISHYPNLRYLHLPHYVLGSWVQAGAYGIKADLSQKKYSLADIDRIARDQTGMNWSVYGMKKNDSLNRRLQLNTYKEGICEPTNKVYPLMDYSNKQIANLVRLYRLPKPISYGKSQSSGEDLSDMDYLYWLYNNYPNDLKKLFDTYPETKTRFYEAQIRR